MRRRHPVSYLRSEEPEDAGTADASRHQRSASADAALSEIQASGGKGSAVEADLTDPEIAVSLFDAAERSVGPVDILVNNASGWVADTFEPREFDRLGRSPPLSALSFDHVFGVDARGAALLIAEFAKRHVRRDATWGRICRPHVRRVGRVPRGSVLRSSKGSPGESHVSAAFELASRGVTANLLHPPVTDTGWITPAVVQAVEESTDLSTVALPEEVARVIAFLSPTKLV